MIEKKSYEELKALREKWIKEGEEKNIFEAARLIGKYLAVKVEVLYRARELPRARILTSRVIVHYKIVDQVFPKDFPMALHGPWELVTVTVGGTEGLEYINGKRVLMYTFGDAQDAGKLKSLDRFIPGNWEKVIETNIHLAEACRDEKTAAKNERRRADLQELLLIGEKV